MSLHRHIQASYKFDNFSRSFVDILAAQQTPEGSQWYQGTADAVRQNMRYFLERPYEFYLILSGDQLYRMDFRSLLHQHIRSGAEITLATKPVKREQASDFGIMLSGGDRRITRFVEKPKEAKVLDALKMDGATLRQAIISDGCIISDGHIERSVIGVRSIIQSGATIRNSVVMGADYYELNGDRMAEKIPIGIGRNCVIDRAIIDKNARIADGVVITPEGKPENFDAENYYIRDGIVVIPKNATIPPGFWI